MQASTDRKVSGFTLLEIMVVLIIIGITVSIGVLSIRGADYDDLMAEEARRLDALLQLAINEAILRSEERGIIFDFDTYAFLVLDDGQWVEISGDAVFRRRDLPEGITLEVESEEVAELLKTAQEEEEDTQPGEKDDAPAPQVLLLSSGEVTPFTLTLAADQSDTRVIMTVNFSGDVEIVAREF